MTIRCRSAIYKPAAFKPVKRFKLVERDGRMKCGGLINCAPTLLKGIGWYGIIISAPLQNNRRQWWQRQHNRVRTRLPVDGTARHRLAVEQAATAVAPGVAVEDLVVFAGLWHAETVAIARHRGKIARVDQCVLRICTEAHKRDDAIVRIMWIYPGEARTIVIENVQRRLALVKLIQVAHKVEKLRVTWIAGRRDQMPIEALLVVPLAPLSELAAHKEQLLARMPPHIAIEGAQVGVPLPQIARHLVNHRAFDMHNFVVGERQDEILREGIHKREGDIVV